tara:strand:+ start:15020 stop:15472 length:453 start_codon:yes stop_codon:yes gene_type:complete
MSNPHLGTLQNPTNNQFHSMPALMEDKRQGAASWNTEASVDQKLKEYTNSTSNWEYRKYLTSNANEVMSVNFRHKLMENPVQNQITSQAPITNRSPYLYGGLLDKTNVASDTFSSDLKDLYLTRVQLQAKHSGPSVYHKYIEDAETPEVD